MLSEQEWESLCNQCGKCCHLMLDDGSRSKTEACILLNTITNKCTQYDNRFVMKHKIYSGRRHCVKLCEQDLKKYVETKFLPDDCAYILFYLRNKDA